MAQGLPKADGDRSSRSGSRHVSRVNPFPGKYRFYLTLNDFHSVINGQADPVWYDSVLDVEVEHDQLKAWVARILPIYTINDLGRMKAKKFFRLVRDAEKKHKGDVKRLRS